jgi:Dynamin family
MSGLSTYRDRRLELGDMIRAALHVARASGDQLVEKRARELLARLAADRFELAVVGQFSRGKTTLMNALLGGAYLPMGALPMTSVITTVRFGSRPRAIVHRRASPLPVEVPLAEVAGFVAQASARRAELQVVSVQVEIPAEILRLGFEFVDTPGVGSAIEVNTATTRQFLPQADAVIFVTGFDSPLTEAEAGFLTDAARYAGRLFLVLNKRDLVSDRDAAQAVQFVRRRVCEDLGIGEPRLFALSALEGLEAVVQGDRGRLSGSGLPQLRAALDEFLITDKTRTFLGNIADRATGLVSGQRRDLRLGRLRLDGGPDPSAVLAAFDARMDELGRQRSAVADKIADRIDAGLPALLAARSRAWQASLRNLIEPRAGEALAAAADGTVRSVLEDARGKLEEAGREIVGAWLDRRLGEVHELLTGLVAGEIGELLELSRSPGGAGAAIAGLAADGDNRELAGWSAEDVPALAVLVPEWAVPVQMPRRSRRKADAVGGEVRRYLEDALTAAIVAFDERARDAWREAADRCMRRLIVSADSCRRCRAMRTSWRLMTSPAGWPTSRRRWVPQSHGAWATPPTRS